MKIQYVLGTSSYSPIYDINDTKLMEKQLQLSFPLITSVKLFYKKNQEKQIYVGKSFDLNSRFWLEKYDLSLEDILDVSLSGYKKACLLNYKKYDQVIVGIEETDEVVPDYYALKQKILEWKEKTV